MIEARDESEREASRVNGRQAFSDVNRQKHKPLFLLIFDPFSWLCLRMEGVCRVPFHIYLAIARTNANDYGSLHIWPDGRRQQRAAKGEWNER